MLYKRTIPKSASAEPALDQQRLFALGLEHLRRLSGLVWTDHNLHDPGVTILELLAYALTDLGYRASQPIADLLTDESGRIPGSEQALFRAEEILPARPLTASDYRKLLIDVVGVKNAWIVPAERTLYADPVLKTLSSVAPVAPSVARPVQVRGLYRVLIELMESVPASDASAVAAVLGRARDRLNANRNLCEDFVEVAVIEPQPFIVCGELELSPDADADAVLAELYFSIERYLAPPVISHTLEAMRQRTRPDGSPYTVEEIFDGPRLDCGFIDDEELSRAELRRELRLSDVISVAMDIEGVRAVRQMLIGSGADGAVTDRWVTPVATGRLPTLDRSRCRVVMRKRGVPVAVDPVRRDARYAELVAAEGRKLETPDTGRWPSPTGRRRSLAAYRSFQNDFPRTYGLSESGLPPGQGSAREAQALQLKAYLLFFDQVMADFCQQTADVGRLFSISATAGSTYSHQPVDSFRDWGKVYLDGTRDAVAATLRGLDDPAADLGRRSRFLDHLISRFAERFHDYASVWTSVFGGSLSELIEVKRRFLQDYPATSADRGLGFDRAAPATDRWDTANVSGLERRLGRLLGIEDVRRRNLGATDQEGMLLIENILLLPGEGDGGAYLHPCAEPGCVDCSGDDPYSYRIHVVLPAYAERFKNIAFRQYVESVIREETPAHILPKVCWVSEADMQRLEEAYRSWLVAGSTGDEALRGALVEALESVRSVYPTQRLGSCDGGDTGTPHETFILGQTRLGTEEPPPG